ncbi:DUF4132 domain-containing protein [Streptomyces sp. NPDC126499]|uniref:DUF4132 domain-containing protein n=1 Tax=Streptomyces sp. NPDC126499 TaxID=3155314 RepID=UPI00332E2329
MSPTITWHAVGGYALALDPWTGPRPVLRCRTAAGRELKKLPAALKNEPLVRELTALAGWIADHTAQAVTRVESWMTGSLPVPAALIRHVWPDPCWRQALRYAVIAPAGAGSGGPEGERGAPDVRRAGILTGVAPGEGGALSVTGPDGDHELDDTVVVIPHPVLLDPRGRGLLTAWRELLDRLGGQQGVEQLHRAVYVRPDCSPAPGTWGAPHGLTVFHGAAYSSGAHFERVVTRFGGRIDGERAGFGFGHRGRVHRMVAGLRYQGPMAPVDLRNFSFTDCQEGHGTGTYDAVPLPVWSEGIRAMAALYDERDTTPSTGAAAHPAADADDYYQAFLAACAQYAAQGAPRAAPPAPPRPTDERQLLDAGAVLPGAPKSPDEEALTARRYTSPVLADDGDRFVRLLARRTVEAQDAVARTVGLEPDADDPTPVGRTQVRPLDFLSRVCAAHPELVREAMGLLAPLHSCATTARTKPGRAANQLRASLKKATAPHPELLPYALDEGARIVAAASTAMARTLYTEARSAEKRIGTIDEDALRDLVAEFGELGVLDATSLARYRDDLATRTSPGEAHEAYRRLVLAWCRRKSGSAAADGAAPGPRQEVPASFAVEVAKGAGGRPDADDVNTEIFHLLLRSGAFEKAAMPLWTAWAAPLRRDLAEHPDTADLLARHMPQPQGSSADAKTKAAEGWLAFLAHVGALERCTGGPGPASPETARHANAWLTLFLERYAGMRQPVAGLEPVLAAIATRLREAGETREPLLGLRTRSLGGDFSHVGVDLALHARMRQAGLPFGEPAADRRVFALQWLQRQGGDGVEPVLTDPAFRAPIRAELTGAVRGSLGYTVTRHDLTPFPKVTRQVAALAPFKELMTDILDERARRLGQGGPDALFAAQDLLLHVEPFIVAGTPHPFDAYVTEALTIDPAVLLADTLRARCQTHGHDGDPAAACGLREVTADHTRTLLRSTDATLRARHAGMFAVEPAARFSRYLDHRPGSDFAYALLPEIERRLPEIPDDSCRTTALGVVQGVLWLETWQETLRPYVRATA